MNFGGQGGNGGGGGQAGGGGIYVAFGDVNIDPSTVDNNKAIGGNGGDGGFGGKGKSHGGPGGAGGTAATYSAAASTWPGAAT